MVAGKAARHARRRTRGEVARSVVAGGGGRWWWWSTAHARGRALRGTGMNCRCRKAQGKGRGALICPSCPVPSPIIRDSPFFSQMVSQVHSCPPLSPIPPLFSSSLMAPLCPLTTIHHHPLSSRPVFCPEGGGCLLLSFFHSLSCLVFQGMSHKAGRE